MYLEIIMDMILTKWTPADQEETRNKYMSLLLCIEMLNT
jgi:hypothetical protein